MSIFDVSGKYIFRVAANSDMIGQVLIACLFLTDSVASSEPIDTDLLAALYRFDSQAKLYIKVLDQPRNYLFTFSSAEEIQNTVDLITDSLAMESRSMLLVALESISSHLEERNLLVQNGLPGTPLLAAHIMSNIVSAFVECSSSFELLDFPPEVFSAVTTSDVVLRQSETFKDLQRTLLLISASKLQFLIPLFNLALVSQVKGKVALAKGIRKFIKFHISEWSKIVDANMDTRLQEETRSATRVYGCPWVASPEHDEALSGSLSRMTMEVHIEQGLSVFHQILSVATSHFPGRLLGSNTVDPGFRERLFSLPTDVLVLYGEVISSVLQHGPHVSVISFLSLNYFIEHPYASSESVESRLRRVVSEEHGSFRSLEFIFTDLIHSNDLVEIGDDRSPLEAMLILDAKEVLLNLAVCLDMVQGDPIPVAPLEDSITQILESVDKLTRASHKPFVTEHVVPARVQYERFLRTLPQ